MTGEGGRELVFVSTLGQGGFGAVYLAWLHGARGWRRQVAVKLMNAGVGEADEARARQWDEARLLGLLSHPNIVQVVDVTEIDGRPAALMEYVAGADLSRVAKAEAAAGRAFSARAAAEVGLAVCAALDAAWSAPHPETGRPLRVIHRDLKPANLLLTPHGGLKVLDFGIARGDFAREAVTRSAAYGTPRYMAPEQWTGEELGPGTDVYALGVTLWELLSGRAWERPPLLPDRFDDAVADSLGGIEGPLRSLLGAMLAFAPRRRPVATEVAAELDGMHLGGETLHALARRVVPELVAAAPRIEGRLPDPVELAPPVDASLRLDEPAPAEATARLAAPTLPPPPPVRSGRGLRLGALLGAAAVAGGAWWLWPGPPVVEPVEPAPVQLLPAEPAGVDRAAAAAPTGGPAPEAAGVEAADPGAAAPAPEPAPAALAVSPKSSERATGRSPSPTGSTDAEAARAAATGATTASPGSSADPAPTAVPAASPGSAPAPADGATLRLTFSSVPLGAVLSIDGVEQGPTPRVVELAEGPHEVRIHSEVLDCARRIELGARSARTWLCDLGSTPTLRSTK